ncbi:MAG: hypothetical protein RIB41_09990 [Oceanibaculum nanhaiense]|jgi:intergrase/recombinase|uniref:hypothetical protein n=1 Tax=Oceanibaculum nanhaiense TaxID=1909734 RepID=UPI0032EED4E7
MNSDFEKAALAELKAIRRLLEQGAREREDLEHRILKTLVQILPSQHDIRKREHERLIRRVRATGEAGPELYVPSVGRPEPKGDGSDSSGQGG